MPTRRSCTIVIAVVVTMPYRPMSDGSSRAITIRPCSSASASPPPRNSALTIAPRTVRRRSSLRGNARRSSLIAEIVSRRGSFAALLPPAPVHTVFVSYSGHFGGAERILLDLATGLDVPVAIVCPEGALATRARAAGVEVLPVAARSLRVRGGVRDRAARRAAAGRAGDGGAPRLG